MKDSYSRNFFISLMFLLVLFCFLLGLISGYTVIRVEDKLDDIHRKNLIIIYGVDK